MRPKCSASTASRTVGRPNAAATASRRDVSGPRPSSARIACQSAAAPMPEPPPQSPEISPSAGNRALAPSARTAIALMPVPQTTATASFAAVPARSSANRSFSACSGASAVQCASWIAAVSSSSGRSRPAR